MSPLLIGLFLGLANPSIFSVPIVHAEEKVWTVSELKAMATSSAAHYKLSKRETIRMLKTIECESGWSATSTSPTGDYGISQINKEAHPEITKEQMFDPVWSLDWTARHFSLGHQSMWVCYTNLYGGVKPP